MIKTACKKPQIKESPGENAAQLRLLRKAFLKQYVQNSRELSSEQLTAFLLYFALRFLEQNNGLRSLLRQSVLAKRDPGEISAQEFASRGSELLDLVRGSLPANLAHIMIAPNIVSWQEAKIFFEQQSNDFIFADIANLGFAYQIFSLGMRTQQALPALQKADKKISRQELIAFTQLYTPSWVVDFLVANTLIPGHDKKGISKRYLQWLKNDQTKNANPIDLTKFSLLDPACGAGQFLFSAFDLLMEIAEQTSTDKGEASRIILSQNIFGADIDEKALWVAGLGLVSKYLLINNTVPEKLLNLSWISPEDVSERIEESSFLGSIDKRLMKGHFLKKLHGAIVTNPPYLGRKCLSRELKVTLKEQYPNSSNDLAAAFIERSLDMLEPGGKLGVITQASLLTIPSYENLRDYLINNYYLSTAVRCGPGVFPLASGEKIDSLLLLLKSPSAKKTKTSLQKTCFIDLSQHKEKEQQLLNMLETTNNGREDQTIVFTDQANMKSAGALFAGLPAELSQLIAQFPKLGDMAEIRQGLATTDNARFVRYHFDVDEELIGSDWVPYIKGSGSERYASKNQFVVKWADNGRDIKEAVTKAYPYLKGKTAWVVKNEEYYFRPGLCFSFINKAGLAVRRLPAGAIFDVASSAIFAAPEEENFLLAYLNSALVGILANSINQTINLQVGDLKKIPIIPFERATKQELSIMGQRCLQIKERLLQLPNIEFPNRQSHLLTSEDFETAFKAYSTEQKALNDELARLQEKIDHKVRIGIDELAFRNGEEKLICDWQNMISGADKERFSSCDTKLFAGKLLNILLSKMISDNTEDRVKSTVISGGDSFAQFFNMSGCAQNWLEDKLGKSFRQLFCQIKVLDISKLAGEPSRYFSLWLEEKNTCMFFSSLTVRSLAKRSNADLQLLDVFQPIISKLQQRPDWTSKDLYEILVNHFSRR